MRSQIRRIGVRLLPKTGYFDRSVLHLAYGVCFVKRGARIIKILLEHNGGGMMMSDKDLDYFARYAVWAGWKSVIVGNDSFRNGIFF